MGQDRTLMVMEVENVDGDEDVDQKELCLRCLMCGLEDKGESDVDLINRCRPRRRCRGPVVRQWSYIR